MTYTKTIEYVSIDVTSTYATVVDGRVRFCEKTESCVLENFDVPSSIATEDDLDLYLNELLNDSGCDITCIQIRCVKKFSEV